VRKQHIKSHPVASLYVENQSWLRGWLYRKVGCTHLAADLVQDTFERLLKRESYGDVEKSGAYLKTTSYGDFWCTGR
jgi:DNA-directed RNA polymerase specialized sigma24 family protein